MPIETIGTHIDKLNRQNPSHLWTDTVVVLGAGVLNYAGQFPGEPMFGDFLLPGKEIEWGAAMYIHLFAHPGDRAFNRMCSVLFMHAALFSPGVKLPEREAILEGAPQVGMSIAAYQSKVKGGLVPVPEEIYREGTIFATHPIRIEGAKGELLSHLRFIPWQDGGVVRLWGKLPLVGILVFAGSIAKDAVFIKRPDGEPSSVLPMSKSDFAQMVNRLRQQSNMTVRPEPQPTWIASKAYDEGTSTPFMARLFLGVLRIRDQIYDASDRKQRDTFDKTYEAVLMNLHSARGASKEIHKLITGHVEEVRKGTCVVRRGNTIQIDENIDQQLRRQTETFLNSAGRAFKSMQELMRLLGLEIGFLYQKQQSFERGIEKLKKTQPDLAAYLLEVRAKWSERLTNARNALEHAGWVLPRVRYEDHNGIVVAIEPMVDGESVSQFA